MPERSNSALQRAERRGCERAVGLGSLYPDLQVALDAATLAISTELESSGIAIDMGAESLVNHELRTVNWQWLRFIH